MSDFLRKLLPIAGKTCREYYSEYWLTHAPVSGSVVEVHIALKLALPLCMPFLGPMSERLNLPPTTHVLQVLLELATQICEFACKSDTG